MAAWLMAAGPLTHSPASANGKHAQASHSLSHFKVQQVIELDSCNEREEVEVLVPGNCL